MTDDIRVRPARAHDLEAVGKVLAEGFQDKFAAAFGPRANRAARIITRSMELEVPQGLPGLFVAECAGHVVGTIALRRRHQPEPPFLPTIGVLFEELGPWGGLRAMFCLSLLDQSTRRDEAYVSDVSVLAGFRRRGVGQAMLAHVETVAQRWGKNALVLDVSAGNEGARRLYLRLGYEEVKIQRSLLTRWLLGTGEWVRMRKVL